MNESMSNIKTEKASGFDRLGERCAKEFLKLEKLTKETLDSEFARVTADLNDDTD